MKPNRKEDKEELIHETKALTNEIKSKKEELSFITGKIKNLSAREVEIKANIDKEYKELAKDKEKLAELQESIARIVKNIEKDKKGLSSISVDLTNEKLLIRLEREELEKSKNEFSDFEKRFKSDFESTKKHLKDIENNLNLTRESLSKEKSEFDSTKQKEYADIASNNEVISFQYTEIKEKKDELAQREVKIDSDTISLSFKCKEIEDFKKLVDTKKTANDLKEEELQKRAQELFYKDIEIRDRANKVNMLILKNKLDLEEAKNAI